MPPPRDLLGHTADLLKAVLAFAEPADRVVSSYFRQHRGLGPRDRHVLAETAYAVLRRKPLLQHLAQSGAGPLERRLALLGWQGRAEDQERLATPAERAWLQAVAQVDRTALAEPLRHNLPSWLAEPLRASLGEGEFWALADALAQPAPLDLRVNTLKASRDDVRSELARLGLTATDTPWSPWGLRLEGKPAINRLELFRRGALEVQDEGSQLLALLTGAARGKMVVDFCSGAGGKALALGAMMRNTGRLYTFDVSGHRLAAARERVARSGLSNVHPAQIAHERDDRIKRLAGKIDAVLVDAPCSGLGTLRRNPDLAWRQKASDIVEMAAKQQAILASAARLLRPGGRLVYATCSLLEAENEAVAQAFTGEQAASFEPLPASGLLTTAGVSGAEELCSGPCLRLWPHRHRTDGFFAAAWQRR